MHIIPGTNIVQTTLTAQEALASGLLTEGNPGSWFAVWAKSEPKTPVHVYHFGGIHGGFLWQEVADFHTLAEFANRADTLAAIIWCGLQTECFDWLEAHAPHLNF